MMFRRARASLLLLWLVACGGGGADPAPDPCAAAGVCTSPPADGCPSTTTALRYPATGTCAAVAGAPSCDYQPALEDCAAGQVCAGGACVTPLDPCAAAGACTTPPADACGSATVRLDYGSPGTCTAVGGAASCDYQPTTVDCATTGEVCQSGACVAPDPCGTGGVCTTPPADACATATTALRYPASGTCTSPGGTPVCAYEPAQVDCALTDQVCQGGACVTPPDPCAAPGVCTTPPAPSCVSATSLLEYSSPGACTAVGGAASCDYPPVQRTCPAGQICLAGGCVPDGCAIPADGAGFLAFADARSGDLEIRAIRVDGACDQLVGSGPGDDLAPSWSAAAGLIAWTSNRAADLRIVVQPAQGGEQRVLDTGPELATGPALSPDGTLVAFERLALGAANAELHVAPVAGGTPAALAADPANDSGPVFSFSAQGDFVYFSSSRSGAYEVWRVPVSAAGAATGPPQQVTSGSNLIGRPTVSADGRLLAYTNATGTAFPKVVVRDLTTGVERVLSDQIDMEPAFAGAGSSLIAVRTSRYASDLAPSIVLLDVATGALIQRLTDGAATAGTPAFPR